MADEDDPKVVSVHYEDTKRWGDHAVEATVVLDDGRTGSAVKASAEDAAECAYIDAQNSK